MALRCAAGGRAAALRAPPARRYSAAPPPRLFALGRGENGQLGQGDLVDSFVPIHVETADQRISAVACGMSHTATVSAAGELLTWGSNFSQQLGHDEHSGAFTVFEEVRPRARALSVPRCLVSLCAAAPRAARLASGTPLRALYSRPRPRPRTPRRTRCCRVRCR